MRRTLAILYMTFSAATAHADYESVLLKDYIGLTKVMRSYGIEPATLAWRDIETMCLGLKTESDQISYNQCRLEKAMDQVTWRDDSAACNAESRALYPSVISNPSQAIIVNNRPGRQPSITTITEQPLYARNSVAARQYIFDRCMRDYGWRSSRDWHLGQRR